MLPATNHPPKPYSSMPWSLPMKTMNAFESHFIRFPIMKSTGFPAFPLVHCVSLSEHPIPEKLSCI
jgi:hypothetical protein